ncbi:MAG: ComEC/Rec2 family competence protein [Prevotella sp.]|nr:ComEC/Rec2 family competence protein [Prevotella sp.]
MLCAFSFLTTLLLNRKRIAQSVMLSTTIILLGILRMGMVSEHDHERNMMFSEGISTLREQLLSMYDRYDFNEEERTLIYAITLGDKSLLNKEIRKQFSTSGSSHVLALSGLHTGIVFALFCLFFRILFCFVSNYLLRQSLIVVFTLPAIWFFAILTGASPSVIRATVMLTVFSLARLLSRDGISLNVLSFTAILMLLTNPLNLYDIGFQLSFFAVFAIIVVYKDIVNIFQNIQNPLIRWMWQLFAVSTAAQLGTAPLAAFYFHQFSLMYFVSNLVIIPCVTLWLYFSILFQILTLCPPLQSLMAVMIKYTLMVIQEYNDWCASLPHPVITDIHWSLPQLLAIYGLLITLYLIGRICCRR